jgi:hypothetical protein
MESSLFPSRFATSTLPPKLKGFTERRCLYCWLMMKKFVTITWIRTHFQRLWRGGCDASLNPRQDKLTLVLACNTLVSRAIGLVTRLSGRRALFFLSISAGGPTVWLSSAVRDGMGLSADCLPLLVYIHGGGEAGYAFKCTGDDRPFKGLN